MSLVEPIPLVERFYESDDPNRAVLERTLVYVRNVVPTLFGILLKNEA